MSTKIAIIGAGGMAAYHANGFRQAGAEIIALCDVNQGAAHKAATKHNIPGIFTEDLNFLSPEEVNFEYRLTNQKHLVNVGSVGQPRNGVPDSSYVILDGDKLTFRRVKYDVDTTVKKIYNIPELDNFLGDRLRGGR